MSAGVLTTSAGIKVNVDSDSCFHAMKALGEIRTLNQTNVVCSADPVIAAKTVTFTYSTTPTSVVHTVSTTTASPLGTMTDVSMLMVVIVICSVFMSGLFGYRIGFAQ